MAVNRKRKQNELKKGKYPNRHKKVKDLVNVFVKITNTITKYCKNKTKTNKTSKFDSNQITRMFVFFNSLNA